MRLIKGLSATVFICTLAACITQLGTLSTDQDEKSLDQAEFLPDYSIDSKEENNDCGYEEIVVDNPEGRKIKILIPLECVEPLVDNICDPAELSTKNPLEEVSLPEDNSKP